MCPLLLLLLLWVSPSTSERCFEAEKVTPWNRGYKGLLTVKSEEMTTAWSVGICFTDGIDDFEAWKGNVMKDSNDSNCFNITNKCYNGILYPCQCLAFDYIARHADQVSLNVTEVSFNGVSLPPCSAPLQCDAGVELICMPNPRCDITGCDGGCCMNGLCCNPCPKIIDNPEEEACGFCSSTLECPQSCPYCLPNHINASYECVGDSGLRDHVQLDLDNEIANLTSSNLVAFQSANSECSWWQCGVSVLKALFYCREECGSKQDCIVHCAKMVLTAIHDDYCWPCIKRGCCKLHVPCCDYNKEDFIGTPDFSEGTSFVLHATCNNNSEIFADIYQLGGNKDWGERSNVFIPAKTRTIQINCVSTGSGNYGGVGIPGGLGGILASGGLISTDNTWRCSWNGGITWTPAYQIQKNSAGWGTGVMAGTVIPGIDLNAYWIWTGQDDWHGKRQIVNCKIDLP